MTNDNRTPTDASSRGGHPVADQPAPADLAALPAADEPYERFQISTLEAERLVAGKPYLEFLRHAHLSAGLYVLEAGADDPQKPHAEDEVYHVLEGRAVLEIEDRQNPVQPGSVVFVAAGVRHRFHSIASRLSVLVVFAPPESR
jgi:mannose-6-phosphate isomerase-like protein (cupin superfamily)